MRIGRAIRVAQSAAVQVPSVIGWLRPVVLLPMSALTGLTPGQLESILAHELAHIRRHDYVINVLQSAAEVLLFYHPACWWLSRRMRVEREHCCDDAAIEVCGDRLASVHLVLGERTRECRTEVIADIRAQIEARTAVAANASRTQPASIG